MRKREKERDREKKGIDDFATCLNVAIKLNSKRKPESFEIFFRALLHNWKDTHLRYYINSIISSAITVSSAIIILIASNATSYFLSYMEWGISVSIRKLPYFPRLKFSPHGIKSYFHGESSSSRRKKNLLEISHAADCQPQPPRLHIGFQPFSSNISFHSLKAFPAAASSSMPSNLQFK